MQVALHRADADLAGGLDAGLRQKRLEQRNALVHGARRDQDLGHKDLVVLELFTDDVHAVQKALFEDLLRRNAFVDRLLDEALDDLRLAGLKLNRNFM